jgi:sugar phosphate isomerase/epimerase
LKRPPHFTKTHRHGTPVFASTQALPALEALSVRLRQWHDAGIPNIELSHYPVDGERDLSDSIASFPGEVLIHHFFGAERPNLVLNLASKDECRRSETLRHFMRCIEWSARLQAPFFSFHAGYITEPVGRDAHGFILAEPSRGDAEAAMDRFVSAIGILAGHAADRGVALLIENNVVPEHHRGKMLLATPDEFEEFQRLITGAESVGILLDWGHWLVTSTTYGLPLDGFEQVADDVHGIHLHLSHGRSDDHLPWPVDHPHTAMLRHYRPSFITLEGHYGSLAALQADYDRMQRAIA